MLAWMRPDGWREDLVVFDLAARTFRRTVRLDRGLTVHELVWEDDGTVLMQVLQADRRVPGPIPEQDVAHLRARLRADAPNGRPRRGAAIANGCTAADQEPLRQATFPGSRSISTRPLRGSRM